MILRRHINNFTRLQDAARSLRKESASGDHPTYKQPCPERASLCPMASPNAVQRGCGKIMNIDSDTKSITVELSMSKKFIINLNGKFSPDVRFDSNGRQSNILDFNIGDTVAIDWRNTQDGATILALIPDRSGEVGDFAHIRHNNSKYGL